MKIQFTGFKATDRSLDLHEGKAHVIVAPNGTGKSAIADAVRFLALGYVPAFGKRLVDTARLLRGSALEVRMFTEGWLAKRTLVREATGFSSDVHASWVKGEGRQGHDQAVRKLFGEEEEDVAEGLDPRELLSLSPLKRAARIEKIVGGGISEVASRAKLLTVARLVGWEPDKLSSSQDPMGLLQASERDAMSRLLPGLVHAVQEAGMASALEEVAGFISSARADLRGKRAAADELRSRASLEANPELTLKEAMAERARLHEAAGKAAAEREAYKKAVAARDVAQGKYDRVREERANEAANLEVAIRGLKEHEASLLAELENVQGDALLGTNASLQHDIDKLILQEEELRERLAMIRQDNREDVEGREKELAAVNVALATANRRIARLGELTQEALASPWTKVLTIAEEVYEEVHHEPFKGKNLGTKVYKLVRLAKENIGFDHVEASKELGDLEHRVTLLTNDQKAKAWELEKVREGWTSRLDEVKADLEKTVALIAAKKSQRERTPARLAGARLAGELKEVKAKILEAQNMLAEAKQAMADAKSEAQARTEALWALGEPPVGPSPSEVDAADKALEALQARVSLSAELRKVVRDIHEEEVALKVAEACQWALQRVREEKLGSEASALVTEMARFIQNAGRSEVPYLEASATFCEVGWEHDGQRIAVEAMSGGEYTIFCTALAAAILKLRGGEQKVLLVEGGELDRDNLRGLVGAAGDWAFGTGGIALVMTAHEPPMDWLSTTLRMPVVLELTDDGTYEQVYGITLE